jgi:thioredoxin reductase (NADPH)
MECVDTFDALVIGGGPAGLSAAIYLARYNRSVLVIDSARGRWQSHEVNENYLGFPGGIASRRLRELGRKQAERFGARLVRGKVERVAPSGGGFRAQTRGAAYGGRMLIICTGVSDILPDIGETEKYWGRSLFWCITCDGYKVRGARVAVAGRDDAAAITCLQFLEFTSSLVFLTNRPRGGSDLTEDGAGRLQAAGIPVCEGRIDRVEERPGEEGMMAAAVLEDGKRLEIDYMISQQGCEPKVQLAQQLGVRLSANGYIEVDEEQRTSVPGVYAAGDITRQFAHQVVTAAHEGATAASAANYDLYRPEQRE